MVRPVSNGPGPEPPAALAYPQRMVAACAPDRGSRFCRGSTSAGGVWGWDYYRVSQIYLPFEQRSRIYRDDTLEKIRSFWLFRDQVRFAELTLTPLARDNAERLNAMAHALLHFSPEVRVVEKLVESAVMLGCDDEAVAHMVRYRAAYPQAYASGSRRARNNAEHRSWRDETARFAAVFF